MTKSISQRELLNQSGEIMRGLDRGESFVVTRDGVPVGELVPGRRRHFVPAEVAVAAFRGAPEVDLYRLRADLDAVADQDPTPRG
jgi:antitoxin (DNA-binding transcriptional repressor) of toxin-antitoxin stability system